MSKDFDRWNEKKKKIDSTEQAVEFRARELWWCSIGVNVGREQHSQSADYGRPILVVKRFSPDIFWGLPLTTKIRDDIPYRVRIVIGLIPNDVLVPQLRCYDRKRLLRKIAVLSKADFKKITDVIKKSI